VLVLGIDTATRIASVGLVSGERVLAEESRLAVSSHTETLLPLILRVLESAIAPLKRCKVLACRLDLVLLQGCVLP